MPSLVAPTHNVNGLPTEIRFEAHQLPSGRKATIPILNFEQLEQFPVQTLKMKARNLVETIGPDALPPLAGAATQEKLINYILDVQVSLCATVGLRVSMAAFGVPKDWGMSDDAVAERARSDDRPLSGARPAREPSAETRASRLSHSPVARRFAPDARQGYFGGDGALAKNTENFLGTDYRKPMHMIQPAHRQLDHAAAIEVNQAEAAMGYQASKARNNGSIRLG